MRGNPAGALGRGNRNALRSGARRGGEIVYPPPDAFTEGGGAGKPVSLQVALSYARNEVTARQGAYAQWRTNIFPSDVLAELWSPSQFEAVARFIRPEDLDSSIRISADPRRHIEWLQQGIALGVSEINLHNVNREQQVFIEDFGEQVLSALKM